jgi:hypothetical protein
VSRGAFGWVWGGVKGGLRSVICVANIASTSRYVILMFFDVFWCVFSCMLVYAKN